MISFIINLFQSYYKLFILNINLLHHLIQHLKFLSYLYITLYKKDNYKELFNCNLISKVQDQMSII